MNIIDYATRQKIGGSHASISFVKQFPVLTPEQVSASGYEQDIVEQVARLCWFNHDLDGWMEELQEECQKSMTFLKNQSYGMKGNELCGKPNWMPSLLIYMVLPLRTFAISLIPKMCVARAVSTKHSACSKSENSENLASTVPNAWLWRHGINLDLTDRITIKLSNK